MESSVRTAILSPRSDASAEHAEASFEQLYEEHVDFVWRNARRLGIPEAALDDVVQQVFMVVHRRLGDFVRRSSVKSWILAILLRVVSDYRRGVRRKSPHWLHEPVDPDEVAARSHGPLEALSHAEAARIIDELLQSLEEDKRMVFVLAELEQMTAREIGEVTGLRPSVVYTRLRAARNDFERAAARLRQRALRGEP
jgi:RNA polymerase sigma-70 factor (ECF subfamily)